jgi:hypothetical protein
MVSKEEPTLGNEDLRFAIEDARARQEASVALIYFNESQAMSLFSTYATVAIAAASGFAAGFSGAAFVPWPMALALLASAVALITGCYFCVIAMKPADICLPGRDADFWIWATSDDRSMKAIAGKYIHSLDESNKVNDVILEKSSAGLKKAKWLGLLAPLAAILVGLAAWAYQAI